MAGWFAHAAPILAAAARIGWARIVERSPLTRGVVRGSCPATRSTTWCIVTALRDSGRYLGIDYLGGNVTVPTTLHRRRAGVPGLLDIMLGRRGVSQPTGCDHARGVAQAVGAGRPRHAARRSRWTTPAPSVSGPSGWRLGAVDAEDHTTADSTLSISGDLRVSGHGCAGLSAAHAGGARSWRPWAGRAGTRAPERTASVAYQDAAQVTIPICGNASGIDGGARAIRWWPRHLIIAAVPGITRESGRSQVISNTRYTGVRDDEQRQRPAPVTVRVYVPFGTRWYRYFLRRLVNARPTWRSSARR